jgi:hypothetical protein
MEVGGGADRALKETAAVEADSGGLGHGRNLAGIDRA